MVTAFGLILAIKFGVVEHLDNKFGELTFFEVLSLAEWT